MFSFDELIDRNHTGACKWDRRTDEEKRLGLVPMSVADMEFGCAPCIKQAVVNAAEHGLYGYTDPEEEYWDAVTGWFKKRHGLTLTKNEISCIYGVVPAISVCVRALTKPGEAVVVPTPVYYPFRDMIESNGRTFVPCALDHDENGRYTFDFDAVEKAAARPEVRMLLLCSPHNPVGRVWTEEELKRLNDICVANDVIVVSDEIHFDVILRGRHIPFTSINPDSVVLTSPSKSFNLPGLQLANIIMPNHAVKREFDRVIHSDGYSNISYFGRAATIAAYTEGEEWLEDCLEYLRGNFECFKRFFAENFPKLTVTPLEGTYLAWVDFNPMGLDIHALEEYTRKRSKLFLDEGYIFGSGGEGYERFNIALPRNILLSQLERLKA